MIFTMLGMVFVTAAIASDIAQDILDARTKVVTVRRYKGRPLQ